MAAYYFDTSAVVKRYAVEVGSTWVTRITARAARPVLYTVRLTGPEVISGLLRKRRTGEVPRPVVAALVREFRHDWRDQYRIVEVSISLADQAMDLIERHGLRGYDAVHLASALDIQRLRRARRLSELTFISADGQQLQAAAAEGLAVENPNDYP